MNDCPSRTPSLPAAGAVRGAMAPMALAALVVLAVLAVPPTPASAQSAVLTVHVRGPEGPLGDALVDVLLRGASVGRALSDAAGRARVTSLPDGTFSVRVEVFGHQVRVVEGVRLTPGGTHALEVALLPAPIAVEGLTVRTGRTEIRRENMEFSTQVEENAILLLPIPREANDLVALTPGARSGNVWGGANFQANAYRLDGLSTNHPGTGGDLLKPSLNWIERLEVRGLGAGAEYGGFQGGLIDIVTKRGTNDFQGFIRSTFEHSALSASNLVTTEIGSEVAGRTRMEAEVRGAVARDKLFYYVSGERVGEDRKALNHLKQVEGRYAPMAEESTESKLFGKLTWTPGPTHLLEFSGAYTDVRGDDYGITGYEGEGAAHRYTSPTWFLNASATEVLGTWGVIEARVNHFERDERYDPYHGTDVPGIRTFALTPPYTAFGNAPFTLRSAPSSTSASLQGTLQVRTGTLEHSLKVGAELTRGSFLDLRERNGGMTWLPASIQRFDPEDPTTWPHRTSTWVGNQWGGEVHLDADVAATAAYAQGALSLGRRVIVTPGIRWGRWTGWLTPRSGDRFQAVQAEGWDPRVGLSVDVTGDRSLVAKAHWGRYHQSLISQMFDRVAGADVFTNEEYWYYTAGDLVDPRKTFTVEERDALAAAGKFRKAGEVVLNETGPLSGYRQPYVDQWLVGVEKRLGDWMKVEALYTRRSNHDMVALVDRNRESNYTVFRGVRVYDAGGGLVPFGGGSVYLRELWVPNYTIVERLKCKADQGPCTLSVPGMVYGDTLRLTWSPDYVLTTAPDARREFGQLQLSMEIALPTWGASLSYVASDLEGNLDNVSGYADPQTYNAGPYVRVNEGVNAQGRLENFADHEVKLSLWGDLPWQLRGGAFWTIRSGDHYSPQFQLYGLGFFHYRVNTGALVRTNAGGGTWTTQYPGQELDYALLWPLEGHQVFVGPRGNATMEGQSILDLRLERMFRFHGRDLALSLDLFNALGNGAITQLNTMVNNGPDYGFAVSYSLFSPGIQLNQFYKAPQERVAPRILRLGVAAYF
ncbi:MAG: TonB-dependent receptor [Longimicrobiales bacterium]